MATQSFDPIQEARRNWSRLSFEQPLSGMTSILRAAQILTVEVNRTLAPLKLTYGRYEVLMLLTFSQRGALPLGKMSARLQVHPTSITHLVDKLEKDGFVRRRPVPGDRRAVLAEITDEGRNAAHGATAAIRDHGSSLDAVSPGRRAQLIEILSDLRLHAGDFVASSEKSRAEQFKKEQQDKEGVTGAEVTVR